jgi:hypothetical protein
LLHNQDENRGNEEGRVVDLLFKDYGEVERWIKGYGRGVAVTIAARTAVRTIPMLGWDLGKYGCLGSRKLGLAELGPSFFLPTFRAMATAWVASAYPDQADHISSIAAPIAAAALKAAYIAHRPEDRDPTAVPSAVSAFAAASASDTTKDPAGCVSTAIYNAMHSDVTVSLNTRNETIFLKTLSQDAQAIERGESEISVAHSGLWPGGCSSHFPEYWSGLKNQLIADDSDWRVWVEWYEARCAGKLRNEMLEIAFATAPEEAWKQGPRAINRYLLKIS